MSLIAIREVFSNGERVLDVLDVLLGSPLDATGEDEHGDEKKSVKNKFTSAIILSWACPQTTYFFEGRTNGWARR